MATVIPFTDEQARVLVNLEQHYKVWIEAEQSLASLPYDLRRKESAGRNYLYEIHDRSGNGKSLGPWSPDQEAKFRAYHENKTALKTRREESLKTLTETARLCRALRVPMLADAAGPILHEADRRKLLDGHLLVVGTNAMPAYAVEAGGFIRDAPDETQDFDMAWSQADVDRSTRSSRPMLKAVDPTFHRQQRARCSRRATTRRTNSKFLRLRRALARCPVWTSLDRCRCPSRSGFSRDTWLTVSSSVVTALQRASWRPTHDGLRSRNYGSRGKPARFLNWPKDLSSGHGSFSMPWTAASATISSGSRF